jgi:hypothetical protein
MNYSMNGKNQRERINNAKRMKDKGCYFHAKLLEASISRKSFEGLNKKFMKHLLYLLVIQGWIILKREGMIQSKKGLNKEIWILA